MASDAIHFCGVAKVWGEVIGGLPWEITATTTLPFAGS
jgi:hypothetical protein